MKQRKGGAAMDQQDTTTPAGMTGDAKAIRMLMAGRDLTAADLADITGIAGYRVRQIIGQTVAPTWEELRKLWIALAS
jgi:antitoxin component HigA of HigAB toxin-antitoxin module